MVLTDVSTLPNFCESGLVFSQKLRGLCFFLRACLKPRVYTRGFKQEEIKFQYKEKVLPSERQDYTAAIRTHLDRLALLAKAI